MVALEFDLIWRPSPVSVISSISLPDFLTSVKLVNEALSGWSKDNQQLEEFVVIPLQEAYYDSNFDFFALSGNDSKMAQILQFIDFIDVHLAAISKQQVTRKCSIYKIVRWVNSSISIPQFQNFNVLDFTKHLVGDIKTSLFKTEGSSSECLHPVLIIQPKRQSIRRCCSSHFDVLLAHLESRLLSDGESSLMRMHSTACLEQVISYCQTEPLKVWDVPSTKASERIRRLFNICRKLQAQKEGLLLLDIVGKGFPNNFNPLATSSIARTIVGMIVNAGGKIFTILIPKIVFF